MAGMSPRGRDTALALFALGGAALLAFGSIGLPPPRFEPLGSAAMPRILAGLIALFALIIMAGAWMGKARPVPEEASRGEPEPDDAVAAPPLRSLVAFGLLVSYVAALDWGRTPFVPATVVFVVAMGAVLAPRSWRTLAAFAVFGLVLALLIDAVFTRFLFVDLG